MAAESERSLLDLCVRTKVLLDGVDAWLLSQGREPVNRKERRVWPVVRERLQLSDALARYLGQLGLERRKPAPQDLSAYIEATYSDGGGKEHT